MEYFQHGLIIGILYVVCDACDWCNIHGVIARCWGMFTRVISAINWVNWMIYNGKNILIEHNDYPCTRQSESIFNKKHQRVLRTDLSRQQTTESCFDARNRKYWSYQIHKDNSMVDCRNIKSDITILHHNRCLQLL